MLDDSPEPEIGPIEPGPKPRAPSRPWSAPEDELLRAAVAKYGDDTDSWIAIAAAVPGRTNKSCRKRWKHSLSPTLKKTAWTKEEDELLVQLHAKYPCKWSMIARQISGRTDDACAKRYREALDPSIKQGDWTEEEDRRLVIEYKRWGGRWASVATQLGRSGLGCRNRWRLLQRKKNAEGKRGVSTEEGWDEMSMSMQDEDLDSMSGPMRVVTKSEYPDDMLPSADYGMSLPGPSHTNTDTSNLDMSSLNFFPSSSTSDMDITIDPSLIGLLEATSSSEPYSYDPRLWDILNGGCGCGCGSESVGCSCGDSAIPPFLEIPSESFLDPFHQLSRNAPPPSFEAVAAPMDPHFSGGPLHTAAPLPLPGSQLDIAPRIPMQHALPPAFASQSSFVPSPSIQTFPPPPGPPPSHLNSSASEAFNPPPALSLSIHPPSPIEMKPAMSSMSPRTLAMFEDLPRQFANVDPAKFAAAIALARAKESGGGGHQCKCKGACCAGGGASTSSGGSVVGTGDERLEEVHAVSAPPVAVKKSCCSGKDKTSDSTSTSEATVAVVDEQISRLPPSADSAGAIARPQKRSRSPVLSLPGPSHASSSTSPAPFSSEPGPSTKRAKKKSASPSSPSYASPAQFFPKSTPTPAAPRLSSQLSASSTHPDLKPYACGNPACWVTDPEPGEEIIKARFNTSGELLDHWRREHENVGDDGDGGAGGGDGKLFRCALEGCGKGWKSINGIQYHLQISKAHFSAAINQTVLSSSSTPSAAPNLPSCCTPGANDLDEFTERPTSSSGGGNGRKVHACRHPGCPKVYKQAAGLKYHLAHGHPSSGPIQLATLPPVLYERVVLGPKVPATN